MPAIDSIAVAAMAMPYRPPTMDASQIAKHTAMTGSAVGLHRHAQARDDVGAVAGGGRLRDVAHRLELRAGVVLGDPHDRTGQRQADQRAPVQVHRTVLRMRPSAPA
jgi:hypothetical protein